MYLGYWQLDNRLKIGPTALVPGGVDFDVSQDWIDPVIAGRVILRLADRGALEHGPLLAATYRF